MKRLLSLLFSIVVCISIFAIPARPGIRQLEQPDGTIVEAYIIGDEAGHYITDLNGNVISRNSKGYLVRSADNSQIKKVAARRAERNAQRAQRAERRKSLAAADMDKGLVILVQFADRSFASGNTREAFDDMLNGDNYTYDEATGSVRQYYSDQSDGKFQPNLVVYGPVTLSKGYAYYGSNSSQGNDSYCGNMVAEACQLAYEQYNINLAEFDQDGDGYVDFVDILYAGYGEADYGGSDAADCIWPCEWSLAGSDYGKALTLGNTKINTFSCHQELNGTSRKRAGIGTACHELGHVFGLPDFYDYDNPTVGQWDIMDGGAYLNNGKTPPNFSGYERMCSGWAKPEILNEETNNVRLENLQSSQQIFIVTETGEHNLSGSNPDPKNFFILENRQNTGWDKYLPGHGMLIWRVQYNQTWWRQNTPNARSAETQGMAIMAADGVVYYRKSNGSYFTYGDAGDPFPGTSGVTSYDKLYADWQVTNIKEANGLVTFNFTDKNSGKPEPGVTKTYVRLTEVPADWSGNYLIVNEDASYILDGSLAALDALKNFKEVTIEGNKITISSDYSFDIAKTDGGYSLKSASGLFIGNDEDANSIKTNDESAYLNTVEAGDDGTNIVSAGTYLRYNSAGNQKRFRYYKAASYKNHKPVVLYRAEPTTALDNVRAKFNIASQAGQIMLSGLTQDTKLAVYNIAGQLVYSDLTPAATTTVNVNSGIYLVRVAQGGDVLTRKIIVE